MNVFADCFKPTAAVFASSSSATSERGARRTCTNRRAENGARNTERLVPRIATALGVVAALLLAASPHALWAADAVRTIKATLSGTIEEITPETIRLARSGGRVDTIPVNEVLYVRYDGEPSRMSSIRNQIRNGQYGAALDALAKLADDPAVTGKRAIQQEVEYYQAYAEARRALIGGGDIRAAGAKLRRWVEANANSYHWYEANQLLGDLLVALGVYDRAIAYYDRVEQAPWNDVKMAAQIAKGRALLKQGKIDAARQSFEKAEQLAGDSTDPLIVQQKQAAQLGKAMCLTEAKQFDQAIDIIQQVIVSTDPENVTLSARAYNTLGRCLRKAGRTKEALWAFLQVDLLYFTDPVEHAEALKNLAKLWIEVDKPDRAIQAEQTLKQKYGTQ